MNSALVNWLPWSVLKISGLPYFAIASSTASMQKSVLMLIDTRQDENPSGSPSPTPPPDTRSHGSSGCR